MPNLVVLMFRLVHLSADIIACQLNQVYICRLNSVELCSLPVVGLDHRSVETQISTGRFLLNLLVVLFFVFFL